MDELNQMITQVIMDLNNNDKAKIMQNINKKEIVTNLIYNLLKEYEEINENKKIKINENFKDFDNDKYMLLLNGMYH
jgi:hypothetical protein